MCVLHLSLSLPGLRLQFAHWPDDVTVDAFNTNKIVSPNGNEDEYGVRDYLICVVRIWF